MNAEQSAQIEMLYLQMFDGMMAYARSSLPEEALAEEAVQETFRIACQKAEALCNSPNPKGWLIKTLKFTIQNIKRSRESMRLLLAEYLAAQAQQAAFSEDKIREAGIECRFLNTDFNTCLGNIEKYIISVLY